MDFRSDPDNFQFAIISDLTGGYRQGIFDDAVKKLNLLEPEFVMSVGDLIQGYTENETSLDDWSQLPFVVGENYGEMRKNHWEWNGPDDNSFRFGTAEKPTRFLKADELPESSRAASVIVPGGHIAEIALPTAYIEQRQGKPWQAFRLSIAVCDIDGEEDRGSQIWWKPFWRSDKNVIGSGTFVRE